MLFALFCSEGVYSVGLLKRQCMLPYVNIVRMYLKYCLCNLFWICGSTWGSFMDGWNQPSLMSFSNKSLETNRLKDRFGDCSSGFQAFVGFVDWTALSGYPLLVLSLSPIWEAMACDNRHTCPRVTSVLNLGSTMKYIKVTKRPIKNKQKAKFFSWLQKWPCPFGFSNIDIFPALQ